MHRSNTILPMPDVMPVIRIDFMSYDNYAAFKKLMKKVCVKFEAEWP